MSNTGGTIGGVEYHNSDASQEFYVFDRLPAKVRSALIATNIEICSPVVMEGLRSGVSVEDMCVMIAEFDSEATQQAYAERGFH